MGSASLGSVIAGYKLPDKCPLCGGKLKDVDCTPYLHPNPLEAKAKVCLNEECCLFVRVEAEILDADELESYKEVD